MAGEDIRGDIVDTLPQRRLEVDGRPCFAPVAGLSAVIALWPPASIPAEPNLGPQRRE